MSNIHSSALRIVAALNNYGPMNWNQNLRPEELEVAERLLADCRHGF